jgi:hypothetical protein
MILRSAFGLGLAALLSASSAAADDPAAARAQLEVGYGLKGEGKYAEALPHLLESLRLDVQVKTLTNLADCEEHLGKLVDAEKHWVLARDRAGAEGNEKLREGADERLRAVEARMPKLTIRIAPGSPGDAEVVRDGTQLGAISLGLALPADPGPHTIVVRARGRVDAATTVSLGEAERKETIVSVGPEAIAEAPPPSAAAVEASPAHRGLGTRRTVAVVSASAGGAALVLGTIFGVAALTTWGNAETDCGNGCGPGAKAQSERTQALTEATVSTAGFIAGAVLVVGGAALWLTAPESKEAAPPSSAGRVGVAVVPGAGGLSVVGAF